MKVLQLKIKLFPNAGPICVKLRKYSGDQKTILKTIVDKLEQHD